MAFRTRELTPTERKIERAGKMMVLAAIAILALFVWGVAMGYTQLAHGAVDTEPQQSRADCVRELREMFRMGTRQARRICDPKNVVKPDEYGWVCEQASGPLRKEKGMGARLKRDAICE